MKINISTDDILKYKTEFLIVGVFEDFETDECKEINDVLDDKIHKAIESKRFKGDFKETMLLTPLGKIPAEYVLVVGLGKKEEFNIEKLRKISGYSAKIARDKGIKTISSTLTLLNMNNNPVEKSQAITEATILSLYQFNKFKTLELDKIKKIEELILIGNKDIAKDITAGIKRGLIIAESVNYVKDLVNYPSVIKTPTYIEEEAKSLAKEKKLKITVFGKADLEKKGFNAILAVSRGSNQDPKLVIIEYNPKQKTKTTETIAIVGKGITFDSGGLNIKTGDYMDNMKYDMAGSAVVLGTLLAASQLEVKKRVIGVMPLSENMPGPSAQKPGDIIKAYNKKTIEMLNSDAEGRLILADALAYTETLKPDKIIDLATLTGACIIALGNISAAILGNNKELIEKIIQAGYDVNEKVWELPMWDEYKELVKGENADVSNIGKKGSGAGVINGASFLSYFVEKTPWAHIDIAGTAFINEERDYISKNATGWGVRLLVNYLEK
ncbi:MAG: leucyl aminopeptidase [Candidatus Woesearchaeota archaeon]